MTAFGWVILVVAAQAHAHLVAELSSTAVMEKIAQEIDAEVKKSVLLEPKEAEKNLGASTDSMTPAQLILFYGYPLEVHRVHTADGYILGVYRIPHGKKESYLNKKRPAVLLNHGLLDSCAAWTVNDPTESLAYILAEAGYDVWMANQRGTTNSLEHETLSPSSSEFWDFTFDEFAAYDLPATVDYVLEKSGQKQIGYIGHSQGTLIMFAALAEFGPEFGKKISMFDAYGPVAYATRISSPLINVLLDVRAEIIFKFLGNRSFLANDFVETIFGRILCRYAGVLCEDIMFLLAGFDSSKNGNMNQTRVPTYVYNTPAGTSVKNMIHWTQLVQNGGKFTKYDYGEKGNMEKYGQSAAPEYDLTKVSSSVDIELYSGGHDVLADAADVMHLVSSLPRSTVIDFPEYNHLDFTWGMNAHEKIYTRTLARLEKHFGSAKKSDMVLYI